MHRLQFEKYEGLGNDFILVDLRSDPSIANKIIKRVTELCERRFGIGADGVILIFADDNHDARVEIYNSDGSRPEMCGNGIRCVARLLASLDGRSEVKIGTDAGVKICRIASGQKSKEVEVIVEMGRASFELNSLPCLTNQSPSPFIKLGDFDSVPVSMGNPHAVIFTDKDPHEMAKNYGPSLEVESIFPKKCNIEFARQISSNHFQVGVWERGCGITLACGTGACAVAAAALQSGKVNSKDEVKIDLPGGTLWIDVTMMDKSVLMRGSAKKVFSGEVILSS
jgi:diaminopimelate epimerase